jgi:mRNA deadenylase 3'-5' endonuclease subunit Ccr4
MMATGKLEANATDTGRSIVSFTHLHNMINIKIYTTEAFKHYIKLQSAYATANGGVEPEFTFLTDDGYAATLDFIWYGSLLGNDIVVKSIGRAFEDNERDKLKKYYLPSESDPSDHLPIIGQFQILNKQ